METLMRCRVQAGKRERERERARIRAMETRTQGRFLSASFFARKAFQGLERRLPSVANASKALERRCGRSQDSSKKRSGEAVSAVRGFFLLFEVSRCGALYSCPQPRCDV